MVFDLTALFFVLSTEKVHFSFIVLVKLVCLCRRVAKVLDKGANRNAVLQSARPSNKSFHILFKVAEPHERGSFIVIG